MYEALECYDGECSGAPHRTRARVVFELSTESQIGYLKRTGGCESRNETRIDTCALARRLAVGRAHGALSPAVASAARRPRARALRGVRRSRLRPRRTRRRSRRLYFRWCLRVGETGVWARTTESVLESHVTCASRWNHPSSKSDTGHDRVTENGEQIDTVVLGVGGRHDAALHPRHRQTHRTTRETHDV